MGNQLSQPLPKPESAPCGITFLSVYTGLGAFDIGLERAGMRCVGQIEIDAFCNSVLAMHWPDVPRFKDVQDVATELVRFVCGTPDIICGGFACQDLSAAGKGAGLARTTRSGLTWRNLFRLIRGLRPVGIILENVPPLRTRGYDRVADALERIGYTVRAFVVGAEHCGAPHKRHRVWIVGNSELADRPRQRREQRTIGHGVGECGQSLADTSITGLERGRGLSSRPESQQPVSSGSNSDGGTGGREGAAFRQWPSRPGEPQHEWEQPRLVKFEMGAHLDGTARELVRCARRRNKEALKAAGNSLIWVVPYLIGRAILSSSPSPCQRGREE
jgi:DNA (cytosine-5)-methyltransferase 1